MKPNRVPSAEESTPGAPTGQPAATALRESQDMLALFLRHSPIYTFIKEVSPTESRTLVASENYRDMIGIPGSQMIGKTMAELFPPEFAAKITADDWAVVQQGKFLKLDEELNGRHYETIKFPIVRHDRTLLAGYTIDVTDRWQTEAALRESRETLMLFLRHSPIHAYLKEVSPTESRFLVASDDFHEMLGRPVSEMAGKTTTEVFPPEDAAKIIADDWDVVQRGTILKREEELSGRHYETVKFPITRNGQTLLGGYSIDVTERKQAEARLAENGRLLRIAGRTATIGGWSVDLSEDRMVWSDEVAAIHDRPPGYSPSVAEGISYYAPEWRARIAQVFHACAVQGVPYDETMEIISAQGHRRWVRTHGEPVRDPSGKIVKVEGAIQDITRHKTADAERERLQAQLAQLQKIESVGRLAGGVAHDFNNMLQVILGHADFALERLAAGESVEDDLQEIRRAATRSADLTRQLLAYARKQTIAPRILNLNETIAGMLQMLRRLIGEHIRLIWQPHVDLAPIRMDPSQLDQILANLCVNARDAITGAGTVTIRTRHAVIGPAEIARHPEQHPGDYICLSVTDDGAGMEPEVVAQLFEPFFTTKNVGRGIGLGLATIYGIVRQNGGFIDVNSQPGQGSCFRIFLPKHKIADLAPPMRPPPPGPGNHPAGGRRPGYPDHLQVHDRMPGISCPRSRQAE